MSCICPILPGWNGAVIALLAEALAIGEIIRTGFGSLDQGLRMSMQPDGFLPVIAIEDGELASGIAMALMVLSRLSHRRPGNRVRVA